MGGQPASGKSSLISAIKLKVMDCFAVNGDEYRQYHPNYLELIHHPNIFSKETQIFSNVFTENLIKDAANRKYNLIIEGTMRNPDVPAITARVLKEKRYKVGIAVIAAHPKITELGVYRRYIEQMQKFGYGRLADIESHNQACSGLLVSVDTVYNCKSVDFIKVYSYLGKKELAYYDLINGCRNCSVPPSVVIQQERKAQVSDKTILKDHLELGAHAIKNIDDGDIKSKMEVVMAELKSM
ncbi:MAG: zeta toxin family protein [Bacteroidales bacterium]|nr:zeta toxin family protein [Bacteroidales bacterium]